jgi:hypothetical protein
MAVPATHFMLCRSQGHEGSSTHTAGCDRFAVQVCVTVCDVAFTILCACLQDTNQKLQVKVRDAATDSNETEAHLEALEDELAKQQ